jgi:hypothetical protein
MFDVGCTSVSFSIQLAVFLASGRALEEHAGRLNWDNSVRTEKIKKLQ